MKEATKRETKKFFDEEKYYSSVYKEHMNKNLEGANN